MSTRDKDRDASQSGSDAAARPINDAAERPINDAAERPINDAAQRRRALDPGRSCIVQAPAGSGKTELLIQRYLALLALAREPEEIAAITFTKKAAAEMKLRVLAALDDARASMSESAWPEADDAASPEHMRQTRALACAALARDAERGWHLAAHAQRLRIQTFDALCAALTRQMPVLSAFGAQPRSVENAEALYREAARATLALLDDENQQADDLALLLTHLDNNLDAVENLLSAMLARRDHWLPHLLNVVERDVLEEGLRAARRAAWQFARDLFPGSIASELCELARYAGGNLAKNGTDSPIAALEELTALPGADEADNDAWHGLAMLLLTAKGEWRKQGGLRVSDGFPPGISKAEKEIAGQWKARMGAVLESLAEHSELAEALDQLRRLPAAGYSQAQWAVLGAITRLLPVAVAQLKLVFAARGEADFVEIAQRANLALGEPEAPTDLMLALDYRIHHLLVDEFQDTSYTQFALLEKLTAGWDAQGAGDTGEGRGNDGAVNDARHAPTDKTLFLVGDPMQSIYRFRQAEVGLFLRARHAGLGGVALESLTLSANFRSRQGIVDWVNDAFACVMPVHEDLTTGAVPYARSSAVHLDAGDAPRRVHLHAGLGGAEAEAERVAAIVGESLSADAGGKRSVAVLVRTRNQLRAIVPALRRAGLRFQAIEIESLGHRQAVQDVYSLTRALAHADDRAAWFAVLRAPWCGLTLADLTALAGAEPESERPAQDIQQDLFGEMVYSNASSGNMKSGNGMRTLWEAVLKPGAGVSADGHARLTRLAAALAPLVENPLRGRMRARVEAAWLALGGPACVGDDTDREDVDIYFDCLAEHEAAGELADPAAFEEAVARLYALPDAHADARLQVMTIHKAKGLEFDTVIVPGLQAGSRSDERRLLAWMETPLEPAGGAIGTLLIAPIHRTGDAADPTYEYLRHLEKVKARHEETRLLYVAATRAREALHWLGEAPIDRDGALAHPPAESLLARLWPVMEEEFAAKVQGTGRMQEPGQAAGQVGAGNDPGADGNAVPRSVTALPQTLRRVHSGWKPPALPEPLNWNVPQREEGGREAVEFSWAGETARHVGTVVHRWMQRIAEDGTRGWTAERVENLREAFHAQLAARGVAEAGCADAAARVAEALTRTLADPRGQWLLGEREAAKSEYRLTSMDVDGRRDWIIDRTFVDDEGRRWIVDFKTSRHEGGNVEAFLDRERERYRGQLEGYARLMSGNRDGRSEELDAHPVRPAIHLGLYFPLLGGWREWAF